MIKNIQEFKNTYVKNTPELRREFLSLAVKFGLIDSRSKIGESSEEAVVAYWHDTTSDSLKVGCWFAYAEQIKEECRELTLSDLKPRTRTEYEKVTESIFDLRDEFERGELYFDKDNCTGGIYCSIEQYQKIRDMIDFNQAALNNNIYRKVKKEIDERQEFVGRAKDLIDASKDSDHSLGNMYDAGCRFQD